MKKNFYEWAIVEIIIFIILASIYYLVFQTNQSGIVKNQVQEDSEYAAILIELTNEWSNFIINIPNNHFDNVSQKYQYPGLLPTINSNGQTEKCNVISVPKQNGGVSYICTLQAK